jgi:methylenetetrahydrofolate dehydrogenase (NADP+)/methenyltetrahydrofolate cyclohydrolase
MLVDGKAIAADILDTLQANVEDFGRIVTLTAVTCAPNFETKKYLEMKKKRAASVGITLHVVELPEETTTEEMVSIVYKNAQEADGVVVQLPLPEHIDKETVLRAVPVDKDPDVFGYGEKRDRVLPPVVGAIDVISKLHEIEWKNKKVVVLGQGTLVGKPAARYARKCGARVRVYEDGTLDQSSLKTADIIISGIGQAHFIKPDMVQEGVILFDAGTSEDEGVLVGDVHPDTAAKAALLTPVPGGIGPITVAYLLKNVVKLARESK